LSRQIEETENAIASLGKAKISLTTQLEDTKRLGDAEARDRASLLSKFKNMNTEVTFQYNHSFFPNNNSSKLPRKLKSFLYGRHDIC
jgi:hypothetical protein